MKDLIRHTNKYFLNPIMMKVVAPHWVFAVVHHVGRKSKKPYATPIIAMPIQNGFLIAFTYGNQVDWYKNVQAANGCVLEKHGEKYKITRLKPIDDINMYKKFPGPLNIALKIMGVRQYVEMFYE